MASCEMPGAIPPHNASLPASEMTPQARARQAKFQGMIREDRVKRQQTINSFMESYKPPETLAEARDQLKTRTMLGKQFPDDLVGAQAK